VSRRSNALLWAGLWILQLAPVWALRWFPSQDGPSHLENANILLLLPRAGLPVFGDYLVLNRQPTPNWLGHLALTALIRAFGPFAAEKILVTAYIVGLPLAVAYAFAALRRGSAPLAVLSFPFLYNCLLHYGFYNFCLSVALFFVALGYWLRRKDRSGWRETAGLAAILLLLYGCHVVSWALALAALAIFAPRAASRLALATIPSAALAAWFFLAQPASGMAMVRVPFAARWNGLWHFSPSVFSYAGLHQWSGAAFALFLASAAAASLVKRQWGAPAVFSALVLALYFIAPPNAAGGAILLERLNLYFFLSLLLWIPAVSWPRAWERFFQTGAAVFTILLLALNWPWYREANRQIDEYLSGVPVLRPNATLLPLVYDPRGPGPLRLLYGEPLRHTASYAALQSNCLNLDNYEAETDLFPVTFRGDRNPAVFIGAMEENPPRVRLDSPRIDYLLVWDPARSAPAPPPEFTQVFASGQGSMRIFRRSGAGSPR
jgi:hypothetical protein